MDFNHIIEDLLKVNSAKGILTYIKSLDENAIKAVLSDVHIKERLIDVGRNSGDLATFMNMANDKNIPLIKKCLFDDTGIEILLRSTNLKPKLKYIIASFDSMLCNMLFENELFCEMVLVNSKDLSLYFKCLDYKSVYLLCDYIVKHIRDLYILFDFSDYMLLKLLQNYNFSDIHINFLMQSEKLYMMRRCTEYLMSNGKIKSINGLSYERLLLLMSYKISIPSNLLNENGFINKIASLATTKDYRFLISGLEKNNDVSNIEEARKKYIDKCLASINLQSGIFKNYDDLLNDLENGIIVYHRKNPLIEMRTGKTYYDNVSIEETIDDDNYLLSDKYLNQFGYDELERLNSDIRYAIKRDLKQTSTSGKRKYDTLRKNLRIETKVELTNMILDYHFEDLAYDILINLNEVLNYLKNTRMIISEENRKIYETFYNLDNMSIEEVISFHNEMKKFDVKSMFYDDYRKIKKDQAEDIRSSILNEEKIKSLYNQEMSDKYGVPIYYLDGEPFYALVKSTNDVRGEKAIKGELIIKDGMFETNADLPSFSLTSNNNLSTFNDPRDVLNLIFSDFDPELIVHTYPKDSFTEYDISSDRVTRKVNKLYSKDELTRNNVYNEILFRARNKEKDDDLNNRISNPKVLGIYAYDRVEDWIVKVAKKNNLPIILINTKKYNDLDKAIDIKKAYHVPEYIDITNYNYYSGTSISNPDVDRRERLK